MRGEIGKSKQGTVDFYANRGTSPDVVADAVVTAIRKRRPVQPVPNSHVYPNWIARRISPRAGIAGGASHLPAPCAVQTGGSGAGAVPRRA